MDNYDAVKEFFNIQTDAMIIAASMEHFGMESVDSMPTRNCCIEDIKKCDSEAKRKWLHDEVNKMLDKFVIDSVSELERIQVQIHNANDNYNNSDFPCRFEGCPKVFKYVKCRFNHERKVHNMTVSELDMPTVPIQSYSDLCSYGMSTVTSKSDVMPGDDHVYNYGCLHLSIGLLLRNADDSVREGDGERLMRVWKFLTLFYRCGGSHKYALAGLRLSASRLALLTPKQAHRLTWNRFANTRIGKGNCISRDLRLEKINQVSKQAIRAIGSPNITPNSIKSATQATGPLQKILQQSDSDLGLSKRVTHHTNKTKQTVFLSALNQIHAKAKMFSIDPGRRLSAFPSVQRSIYKELNLMKLHAWMKRNKDQWHRQNLHYYKR